MAAGPFKWYGNAHEQMMKGALNLQTGLRGVLVTSAYTPDQATHQTWSDALAAEVAAGGNYATHGKALVSNVAQSGAAGILDLDDITWSAITATCKYLIIVKDADANGSLASTDLLVGYVDLNEGAGSISPAGSDLVIQMSASGVLRINSQ